MFLGSGPMSLLGVAVAGWLKGRYGDSAQTIEGYAVGAALVAGGLGLTFLRRRRREQAAFAEVREAAQDDLTALADDVRALELDVEMPSAPPAAGQAYERALGRYEEAERHYERALEMNVALESPLLVAETRSRYAAMLVERDGPGDRERALELVADALDAGQELGMNVLVERCFDLKLRLQGIDASDIRTSIDAVASAVEDERPDLSGAAAPDGTVTILFSDIEGSTEMTERLGDRRWLEVLREHNRIVRSELRAHDGFEVKSQGDGFMVAFSSARRALDCAIAIQRAFAAQADEQGDDAVRVRIGMHTGEAIRERDDFFGRNVILAARIAAQADGGEVLVSSLLKELTESSGDIAFGAAREVTLKGLSGSYRVHSVDWEGVGAGAG
jgi:class 3 adenylate cyclase